MFARVTTVQGLPDRVDRGIQEFREGFTGAAKEHRGFKGAYLLVDRKSGKFVGITLWNTEADLEAAAEGAADLRMQVAQSITATTAPTVEVYEVALTPSPSS